jgi:hypothetical protein
LSARIAATTGFLWVVVVVVGLMLSFFTGDQEFRRKFNQEPPDLLNSCSKDKQIAVGGYRWGVARKERLLAVERKRSL